MDMDDDEELAPDRLTWRALVRVVGLWQQHPHRNKPSERALLLKVGHEPSRRARRRPCERWHAPETIVSQGKCGGYTVRL